MINKKYTHVFRPAALALLVALAAACGTDSPIAPDPDHGQGTPIAIGQLPVAAAAADPNDAAGTYWKDGDAIFVTATNADPDAINPNAIYTYNGSSWAPDGTPLYVERISTALPITIESWGGKPSQGASDPDAYTDQSDPESAPAGYTPGDRYRRNDYLLCPDATLTVRTLSGRLTHSRVDLVLNIADYTDAGGNVLNTLPDNAVLRLNDGSSPAKTVITAYRQGKTSDGTTFRAYIDLEDVPGIIGIPSGSSYTPGLSGTVANGSLLGTLTYTMSGSTEKTLKIRYSITSGTDADGKPGASGTAVAIKAGKRITVSATFADPSYLDATASLEPWTNTDAGDAGTGDINMVEKKDDAGQPIYEIYSAQGLKKFVDLVNGTGDYAAAGKNASANVRLMADIDLSTVCSTTLGKSWEPIGTSPNPYLGCFDGQGYTVKGLYIKDKDTNYTGLFGVIGQNGVIRRLRVEAEQISSSAQYTGVLAGWNKGTITACQAVGDVTGKDYTGGLVGYNSGTITACCATGNASGTSNIGGLVGYNNGTITACYATGNASGTDGTGGLVGFNDTAVSGILQHCATTQPTICKGNPSNNCQSNVTSFSAIRAIVASEAAQNAWGKSIGTDGLIQNNETGRVLNAPWNSTADDSLRAIWKTPVDGTTTPGDQITGGHLQLWWQTNP